MQALTYERETWRQQAACARLGVPTGVFFSDDLGDIAQSKLICADCPVMESCLEGAIRRGEPWGCLLYTSPSPRDRQKSRMPSSA